ncbi:hypothetical protein BDN70DRAFT_907521 [Pholiota conissans]|uniref:Thioesterase domain-containing protein n=1 Tax=Pholiota conissans TaxID=109636 RepID=A0A9P5YX44_9AGAR|nr:hypothetical protein BDN70DRAFT_907521 [Pholiota conissans]
MSHNSDDFDVSRVAGNAPDHIKRVICNTTAFFANRHPEHIKRPIFVEAMQERFKVTEVSIVQKADEPKKLEGRVVLEVDVSIDMLNIQDGIHGGCSAALIDMCSTLALHALVMYNSSEPYVSVSQSMNVIFHSPALLGDKLRLINTTLAAGSRAHSARTEIWNATRGRLVASGNQTKMVPSTPTKL